ALDSEPFIVSFNKWRFFMSNQNGDRHLSRLLSIMRRTEHELGLNNEKRLVYTFSRDNPFHIRINWIRRVRHASREEDARGIDVVFETDVGPIKIQVKS